jgi:hypothetical protein
MFVSKVELSQVKYLKGAPLWDRLLASPANVRLGWKDLPGTNTPAFYENL